MPIVVADTGPLVSAADRDDRAHELAAALVLAAGTDLLVPDPVAVEVDWLVRSRLGPRAARSFLAALVAGKPRRAALTAAQFARAVEFDRRYADLGLGLADASVMALAEAERSPILTFDFAHFRATTDDRGRPWRLVIDEARLAREIE